MYKSILVLCTGTGLDAPVHRAALSLARRSGGHMRFLHIKLDVVAATASADLGAGVWIGAMDDLEREVEAREQFAYSAFSAFCVSEQITVANAPNNSGISCEWSVEKGNEPAVLGSAGRYADLIVLGRERDSGMAGLDVLQAALLESGRPLLIVPDDMRSFDAKTVAIAWKSTPEAARAITAALSLIAAAERVVVFSIEEKAAAAGGEAERLARSLRWHNPNVEAKSLKPGADGAVQTLLDELTEAGASALVMGGYSHGRLREVLFGGFTRRMLLSAPLPVLMAH